MGAGLEPFALTIREAARVSGLSRTTIYELIRAGEILVSKIGKRTLVDAASLRACVERHRVPALTLPEHLERAA